MKEVTELVIIVDKSGSMHGLEDDVIGGINSFIEEQKKLGEARVTTIFFNDKVNFVHEDVDINEVTPLEKRKYHPSGCTALLDAIGDAISLLKAKHSKLKEDELPAHTIFSIVTDGMENASKEYTYQRIKEMIEMQKKCGWGFLFQAANIDTEYEADRLGISRDMAMSFEASGEGVTKMMRCCSDKVSMARKSNLRLKK